MSNQHEKLVDGPPRHRHAAAIVVVASLAVLLGAAMWHIPRDTAPLPAVAREAMTVAVPDWHTLEPVNEVVYGTRGFDTFGETFLLLAAVVGISLLTRRREPRHGFIGEEEAGAREQEQDDPTEHRDAKGNEAAQAESEEEGRTRGPLTPDDEPLGTRSPEVAQGMSVVVRGAVRVVAPVLATLGIYLMAWGYSPGGGFPAGGVLLGVVLLAYVSLGYRRIERVIRPGVIEPLELGGALIIVVIGVLGLVLKGSFSSNFLPLSQVGTIPSGGILQVFSGAELIEVATGLTLAVFALLGMGHDWTSQEDDQNDRDQNDRDQNDRDQNDRDQNDRVGPR